MVWALGFEALQEVTGHPMHHGKAYLVSRPSLTLQPDTCSHVYSVMCSYVHSAMCFHVQSTMCSHVHSTMCSHDWRLQVFPQAQTNQPSWSRTEISETLSQDHFSSLKSFAPGILSPWERPDPPWGEADTYSLLRKDPATSWETDQVWSSQAHSSSQRKNPAEPCQRGQPHCSACLQET